MKNETSPRFKGGLLCTEASIYEIAPRFNYRPPLRGSKDLVGGTVLQTDRRYAAQNPPSFRVFGFQAAERRPIYSTRTILPSRELRRSDLVLVP